MRVANSIAHYRADAEEFDYFRQDSAVDGDSTRRLRQAVSRRLRPPDAGFVLDLGSGDGWVHRRLGTPRRAVVSVDLGTANLRRIDADSGGNARCVCADAHHLPFRDGAFIGAVCAEVLEHVNEPERVMRELARVLTPGATLVASTPYRERIKLSLCIHCNRPTPVNAHIHSFDDAAHRRLAESAGLRLTTVDLVQNKVLVATRCGRSLFRFGVSSIGCVILSSERQAQSSSPPANPRTSHRPIPPPRDIVRTTGVPPLPWPHPVVLSGPGRATRARSGRCAALNGRSAPRADVVRDASTIGTNG
jgi:ubiquinone/menaquinone biosynthesis C-methylase UbiE